MAMDVEYEEYSSTSSSKHHGWKLEVSRRHRETREMEALEARIAAEYAKIDQGLSVGDLTAPRAVRLIAAMDRSAQLPGAIANGPSRDHDRVMFLTYPDREGLCGALPTLETALEESDDEESERDESQEDVDAREKNNASSAGVVAARDPTLKTLASRLLDAMPLVRTRGGGFSHDDTSGKLVAAATTEPNGDKHETTLVSSRGVLFTRRPDRLVEYDYSVGVDRARDMTDAELLERAGAVTVDGDVADTAFRDLNQVD